MRDFLIKKIDSEMILFVFIILFIISSFYEKIKKYYNRLRDYNVP